MDGDSEVQGDVGEGGLEPDPGGNVDVEDEFLEGLADLRVGQAVIPDKGGEQSVEAGKGLGARRLSLEGVEKIHHLAQGAPEMFRRPAFHFSRDPPEAFPEKIEEVPADAVDGKDAQVMDVKIPFHLGLPDFRGIDFIEPVNLAHLRGDVIVQPLE